MTSTATSFDLDRLRAAPQIHELRYFDSIESTNSAALAAARERAAECPALFITPHQTAGRGRGANRWHSDQGALTFSLLLAPPAELARAHWSKLAITTAVAICRLLDRRAPAARSGIRWPNDVYSDGRKIAGILVEAPAVSEGPPQVVIGVGLNVNNSLAAAPADVQARAIALTDLVGKSVDLTAILLELLFDIETDLARLAAQHRSLADDWKTRCLLRGSTVTLEHGPRQVRGYCHGIDDDASLLLDSGRGAERFYAGVLLAIE